MTRPAPNGFTLIELLVSLAVLGMTASLLMTGVAASRTVWQRAEASAASGEQVAAVQAAIRDRIEHIFAEKRFDASTPYVDVRGEAGELSFFAPPADALRPQALQRFRLMLTAAGELTLFSVPAMTSLVDPAAPALNGWTAAPLLDGVQALDLAYFGAAPPDNMRRWRLAWRDRPQPPELVRVRVAFAPGDKRVWPDLVVRPVSTISAACDRDKLTGRCKAGL